MLRFIYTGLLVTLCVGSGFVWGIKVAEKHFGARNQFYSGVFATQLCEVSERNECWPLSSYVDTFVRAGLDSYLLLESADGRPFWDIYDPEYPATLERNLPSLIRYYSEQPPTTDYISKLDSLRKNEQLSKADYDQAIKNMVLRNEFLLENGVRIPWYEEGIEQD